MLKRKKEKKGKSTARNALEPGPLAPKITFGRTDDRFLMKMV